MLDKVISERDDLNSFGDDDKNVTRRKKKKTTSTKKSGVKLRRRK